MPNVRLPIPGEDQGDWGDILNKFLLVALNNDGTLKAEDVILAKANSTDVVHNTGVEVIAGAKTFSTAPIVPSPSAPLHAVNKNYTDAALSTKANTGDLAQVATSGSYLDLTDIPAAQDTSMNVTLNSAQTITGAKNFTGGLQVSGQAIVSSVAGKNGNVTLVKGDIGLDNVDNTADSAKPVSTATQAALATKADTSSLTEVAITGSYSNLLDKPTIPEAGTSTGTYAAGDDSRINGALQKSVVAAKGDMLVATGDATIANIGVGSDGQVLSADSSQPEGVKWTSLSSNVAIVRSINVTSENTTAEADDNTDYVYIITGNHVLTLPTAAGNSNRYTVKNRHSGNVTLAFTGAQNADGAGVTLGENESIELVSDGANWVIL